MRFGNARSLGLSIGVVIAVSFSVLSGCQLKREYQSSSSTQGLRNSVVESSREPLSPATSAEIQAVNDALNASEQYTLSSTDLEDLRSQGLLSQEDEVILASFIKN